VFQVKSQIGHGDLPLKRLGAVNSWSAKLDKSQNLGSGYKSTWHDSETESLCTCEVVGGEQCSVSLGNHALQWQSLMVGLYLVQIQLNFQVMMDLTLWTIVVKWTQEVEGVNYLLSCLRS
jgi:hypothetical protein